MPSKKRQTPEPKHTAVEPSASRIVQLLADGTTAFELFTAAVAPSLEKRRQRWMEMVAEAVAKLPQEGAVTAESLQNNESFINTLLKATQLALFTDEQEKLCALQNAVMNSALTPRPSFVPRELF
jgi:hypothetical protein